ncbi:MAG TPA: DUF296 domain-containing protein [Coxiellaceae bacterium]|nr:MAG: hypothetical protein A3E81_04330 [Gammaproteobacteria bacterium RIFCSPHIGHO2_12_FULL_36_30]HLB56016.1 DUF296 domain-containing protein [Coxiellaceae bacterium]
MASVVDTKTCGQMKDHYSPFLIILKHGEYLHDALSMCMQKAKFGGASFTGLGALKDPVIAYFNLSTKQYEKKTFSGIYELISANGTMSRNSKNEIVVHVHTAIGDRDHNVFGGHLVSGMIGVTGEITVIPFRETIMRSMDDFCGLELINPAKK